MKPKKRAHAKKHFTAAEANATLPLVRVIVQDITALAHDLKDRQDRLNRVRGSDESAMDPARREELQQVVGDFERDQERMHEYIKELERLGIELKDFMTGLLDFPSWMDDREVYLCWRLGEPEVAHWHELNTGFQGRQKLMAGAAKL
jgi:hypothetical protein